MSFNVNHKEVIGHKVWKNPKTTSKFSPKPFKSGLQINTVKDVVISPYTGISLNEMYKVLIFKLANIFIRKIKELGQHHNTIYNLGFKYGFYRII